MAKPAAKNRKPSTAKTSKPKPTKSLAEQIAAAHENARLARRAGDADALEQHLELARELERKQKAAELAG